MLVGSWVEMELAYDRLYRANKVFPEQNFSASITKRAYKF